MAVLSAALAFPIKAHIPVETLKLKRLNTVKLYGDIFENLNIQTISIEDSPMMTNIFPDVFLYTKETLKNLLMVNTGLTEFPAEALNMLSGLETLTLDRHNISTLENRIDGLENLINLQISNGNISGVSKNTFDGVRNLKRLDLHGNQLTTIPRDTFKVSF